MTRYLTYEGKVANRVEVISESLMIEVTGMQRAVTYRTRLEIPLGHVLGAAPNAEIERSLTKGWHTSGGHVPGVRFYNVRGHPEKAIAILLTGEDSNLLITEVEEPAAVAARINLALEGSGSPSLSECA